MMGYRLNMHEMVVARFEIKKQMEKHQDASPPAGVREMKESFMKLRVAAKSDHAEGEKKKFSVRFGRDQEEQEKKI